MKTYLYLFFLLSTIFHLNAQGLNNPESVVFDHNTGCYYVSCNQNGTIQKRLDDGSYSLFASGLTSPLGITINGDVVFVADVDRIVGYELSSKDQVFNLKIDGAKELNDLVFDDQNNCFVSDRNKTTIYKVNTQTQEVTVFNNEIPTPNGLYFDKGNNVLLVCNTVNSSSIYKLDMATGDIVNSKDTGIPHLDGIVMDNKGNIFVTSWSQDWLMSKLLSFDNALSQSPEELLSNNMGMADIFYNEMTDTLVIANWYANSLLFFDLSQLNTSHETQLSEGLYFYPNPASDYVQVKNENKLEGTVQIVDLSGKLVRNIPIRNSIKIDVQNLPAGQYFFKIITKKGTASQKLYIR